MRKFAVVISLLGLSVVFAVSCSKSDEIATPSDPYAAIRATFGTNIDPDNLANYAGQGHPAYITLDNSGSNVITNAKATLGRVLFYDKKLSINNTVACGSCHKQEFAFSDTARISAGVEGGVTFRHSMRLVNARFAAETKFFWNERAASLEQQTTMPIQDHAEMGFSGQSGRPGLDSLLRKLQSTNYYNELFRFVYGDINVTEARMQECLAQFVRSIQSFDSKFDAGRSQVANDNVPFPNYTPEENAGKQLFNAPPQFGPNGVRIGGGAGCAGCHKAPAFDIDPNTRNNGIIATTTGVGNDIAITRAPSLRDVVRQSGALNGPLMHTGNVTSLRGAITHYDSNITLNPANTNLDPRLTPGGVPQRLNLTTTEFDNLIAFLRTLSGSNVYTDSKWKNPFQ
mgnify:CR=1 FL=1|jgi:cytochrome c peroxidase